MAPEVIVALIAGIASIVGAVLTSYLTANRTVNVRLTAIEIKVDLLWKTYIVDAVKASRNAGVVASQSKEAPTDEWDNLLPEDLRLEIDCQVEKYSQYTRDPYDISIHVIKSMEDKLTRFSLANNVNMKILIGVIYVIAENFNER